MACLTRAQSGAWATSLRSTSQQISPIQTRQTLRFVGQFFCTSSCGLPRAVHVSRQPWLAHYQTVNEDRAVRRGVAFRSDLGRATTRNLRYLPVPCSASNITSSFGDPHSATAPLRTRLSAHRRCRVVTVSLLDQRFARQRVSHSAVRGPLNELTLMSCRLATRAFLRSIFAAIRNVRTPFGLDFSRRVVSKRAPSALTTPAGRRGAATTKQHSDGRATRSSNGPFTLDALKASAKQCGRLWRRVSNKLAMSSSAKCSLCKHGPKPRPQ